jgi:mannose-6-phosphate isomerase-like protein (cupin superfamily)
MNAEIRPADLSKESFTHENCFILELANDSGDPEVSIARARVMPGVTTEWHRLTDIDERYVIVHGTGKVEVGDLPPAVVRSARGDIVRIPRNTPQRITNVGDVHLVFLATCTPRFIESAYVQGRGS